MQSEIFLDKNMVVAAMATRMSSMNIPQIAIIPGFCTVGGGTDKMSDEAIIVKNWESFFRRPPLKKAATGEIVSELELGGAELHMGTGCTDHYAENEEQAFRIARSCRNLTRPGFAMGRSHTVQV